MGQYVPDQDFTKGAKRLHPNAYGPFKYTHEYPDGDYPAPTEVTLLKREDFSTGTLSSKSAWISLPYGNENNATILEVGGDRFLRHCGVAEMPLPDPMTGKARDGTATHTFLANTFHTGAQDTSVTLEMMFSFDDCKWNNSSSPSDDYPATSGKMFMSDATVDSLSWYTALGHPGATLAVSSGNDGTTGKTWSLASAGGWSSAAQNRPYKWVNGSGQASNYIYLQRNGHALFQSDGLIRTFIVQVKYNPAGIGHHKVRLGVKQFGASEPYFFKDSVGNTDADGWFPMAIEWKLKGPRAFIGNVDVNNPEDVVSHPEIYTGHAAGFNIYEYNFFDGIKSY